VSSIFRGKFALILKIIILAGVTAILSLLAQSAVASGEIAIGIFLVISIFAINLTYFTKISIPLKFFVPGILLFIAFVIGPILFTVLMSTYNYQTGNYISKEAAIEQVLIRGVEPDANQTTFDLVSGKASNGSQWTGMCPCWATSHLAGEQFPDHSPQGPYYKQLQSRMS
jgi:arabinogalactan oligomer/maltooligosaccharide transport system permease protein